MDGQQEVQKEVSVLKRRIERQEKEYIQTMRINNMLRNQIDLQKQSLKERSKSPVDRGAVSKPSYKYLINSY